MPLLLQLHKRHVVKQPLDFTAKVKASHCGVGERENIKWYVFSLFLKNKDFVCINVDIL